MPGGGGDSIIKATTHEQVKYNQRATVLNLSTGTVCQIWIASQTNTTFSNWYRAEFEPAFED